MLTVAAAATVTVPTGAGAAPPAVPRSAVDVLVASGLDRATAVRRLAAQPAQSELAERLTARLGPSRTAGGYLDRVSGALVVTVVDAAGAATVRAAGAEPRTVRHSEADLARVAESVDVPVGGSTAVDPVTDRLVVRTPPGAPTPSGPHPDTVRTVTGPAAVTQALYGGEQIDTSQWTCSAGFMVRRGSTYSLLTAGHCTSGKPAWSRRGHALGPSTRSYFPGNDIGLVTISNPRYWQPKPAVVYRSGTRPVTGAGTVPVGATVCKSGRTSGTTCGTVQAVDVTVRYQEGRVTNLYQTNVCTRPGDSGGPLYTGRSTGLGMVSGGDDSACGAGYASFFQKLRPALSRTGTALL
ncbi:S1 family peptidase [Actinocatenispora rupis]|uniref:Serine protease n=1 Tax=Actinocatenispora rupis TaxID=519421 RepID=A0A8J3J9G0_9ACTN|nr:serine protease [Actinocatenispora rupis]